MKLYFLFFIFLFIFLVGTLASLSLVYAEEAPQYNFGSMQGATQVNIKLGQEVSTKLYFYNIDGNRPTHINLTIVEKPQNWQISIEPEVHNAEYDVSGQKVSVNENLVVYPSNASSVKGANTGIIEYIQSSVGYIGANFVTIKIKVPENEQLGETENIKINAVAFWLGQSGNIALNQERDFEYTVTTTTEYYEKPYEPEQETNQTDIGKSILSLFSSESQIKPIYLISSGITLILLIIFIILMILVRRNKKKKKRR